jgi:hypothetical protein
MAEVLSIAKRGGKQLFSVFLDVPTRPEDIAKRHHNRFAKESMQSALLNFHHYLFPKRFDPGLQSAYVKNPRTVKYQRRKLNKYGHNTALVYTGATKDQMTSPFGFESLRISGSAEGGKKDIGGRITYRFKFRGGTGKERKDRRRSGVSTRDMVNELQTVTADEGRHIASHFLDQYWGKVEKFRGSRKRIRKS